MVAQEPGHGRALRLLGLLQLAAGRSQEAAVTLRHAVLARPEHAAIRVTLCRALLAAAQPEEARVVADALLDVHAEHPEALFLRGTALNALGQPELAIADLRRAIVLDPSNTAVHLNLGNACADLDRLAEAEGHCR